MNELDEIRFTVVSELFQQIYSERGTVLGPIWEYEVKVLNVYPSSLVDRFINSGAILEFSGEIRTHGFDFRSGYLRRNQILVKARGREEEAKLILKLKVQDSTFKVTRKTELSFGDVSIEEMVTRFDSIGLKGTFCDTKRRETYSLSGVKFHLEIYPNLPRYLEIESESREGVLRGLELCGYNLGTPNVVSWSTKRVFLECRNGGKAC